MLGGFRRPEPCACCEFVRPCCFVTTACLCMRICVCVQVVVRVCVIVCAHMSERLHAWFCTQVCEYMFVCVRAFPCLQFRALACMCGNASTCVCAALHACASLRSHGSMAQQLSAQIDIAVHCGKLPSQHCPLMMSMKVMVNGSDESHDNGHVLNHGPHYPHRHHHYRCRPWPLVAAGYTCSCMVDLSS